MVPASLCLLAGLSLAGDWSAVPHVLHVSRLMFRVSGVPHNVPCLTGASVQGTTVPPCSASKHR